jgi:poly(3-hydroxybutyrate) depolymerase
LTVVVAALLAATPARAADEAKAENFLTLESRPGVKELVVLVPGRQGDGAKHVVLMLSGGGGVIGLAARDGKIDVLGGYPITQRQRLADAVGAVAVVSPPTDQPVMDLDWRETDLHVADLRAAVAAVRKRFPAADVWMLGISNGAVSAAVAVARIDEVAGAVLLSASRDAYAQTRRTDRMRVLAVHHRRDSCLLYGDIRYSAGWRTLVTVEDDRLPRPSPVRKDCGLGSAHQFSGKEDEVLEAIAQWIVTGATVNEIR